MTTRYRKMTLLTTAVLGMGAVSGCEYCLAPLLAVFVWLALTGSEQIHTPLQAN